MPPKPPGASAWRWARGAMLALAALAFLYTTPHIAIGGTFTEFLIGAFILLPVGICFALLAWKTFNRR